ncbi:MAG: T9SS type A sorting domain-containing protein [Nonlabens sp.]|nr:T9SS type A sorting domain-containing protein [Nonlabens sp.]MDP5100621.1 T9SS type A sorting domain-containing protein [Nonlabens sp.]
MIKKLLLIIIVASSFMMEAQDPRLIANTWYCTDINISGTQYFPVILPQLPNVPLTFDTRGPGDMQTWYCPLEKFNLFAVHTSNTSFTTDGISGLFGGCPDLNNMGQEIDLFHGWYRYFLWPNVPLNPSTYSIQSSGNYLMMVITNVLGDTATYSTNPTAGVNDIATAGFALYPNPTTSILNIQFDQNRNPTAIVIYDIAGRKLLSNNSLLDVIETSSLSSGNYVLQVTFDDGSQGTQRFMKN